MMEGMTGWETEELVGSWPGHRHLTWCEGAASASPAWFPSMQSSYELLILPVAASGNQGYPVSNCWDSGESHGSALDLTKQHF